MLLHASASKQNRHFYKNTNFYILFDSIQRKTSTFRYVTILLCSANNAHLVLKMSIVANCVSVNTRCLYSAPDHWHAMIRLMSSLAPVLYSSYLMDLARESSSVTSTYLFSIRLVLLFVILLLLGVVLCEHTFIFIRIFVCVCVCV